MANTESPKVPKNVARDQIVRASHNHHGSSERTLQDRARDLDRDVTSDELQKLIKP